ncbi:MAG: hypothetical protein ACREFL_03000 [Stellaceae bacterium]
MPAEASEHAERAAHRPARALSKASVLVLAIVALALLVRVAVWAVDPDLWLDEAMLYHALKDQATLLPWVPLGQYTQATPILPALLWKTLIAAFGPSGLWLRLPALVASIAGFCALWATVKKRLGAGGACAALLLAAFSATAIVQAAQLKPYSFEFLASALILYPAARLAEAPEDRRALIAFTALSIVALAFTYTAPAVTAACALGLTAALAASRRLDMRCLRRLAPCGLLWVVAGALWQHFVVAPSTHLQFAGNARSYAWEYLALTRPGTWHHIGRVLNVLDPALPLPHAAKLVTFLAVAAWAAGAALGWRRRIFEHGTCLAALACLAALSFAGLFPFAEPRKMLFLLPLFALSFGAAIEDLVARARLGAPGPAFPAAVFLCALLLFPFALQAASRSEREQVAELIDAVPPGTCPTVWTFYLAWPAVDIYKDRRPDIAFLGAIPTASGVPSWSWRVHGRFRDYVSAFVRLEDARPGLCLLFSHTDGAVQRQEKERLLAAVASHRCTDLIDTAGAQLYRCN